MATRSFDPKETVIEAFYAAKELLEGLLSDFKSSDRYFKYKVAIIATWAVLSLTTAAVACPGSGGPPNKLMARGMVSHVGAAPSVAVGNGSAADWRDVKLLLNGTYTAYQDVIPMGGRAVLTLRQFAAAGGKAVPTGTRLNTLTVTCSEGTTAIDLSAPQIVQ